MKQRSIFLLILVLIFSSTMSLMAVRPQEYEAHAQAVARELERIMQQEIAFWQASHTSEIFSAIESPVAMMKLMKFISAWYVVAATRT